MDNMFLILKVFYSVQYDIISFYKGNILKRTIFVLKIILLTLFLSGCNLGDIFGPSQKEIELKQRELDLKEQEIKFNQLLKEKDLDASLSLKKSELEQQHLIKSKESDAKIANDKASIDTKKEIELSKIKSDIEKEKLQIQKQKIQSQNIEKDLMYSLKKQDSQNTLSTQKYLIIFGSIIIIIFSFAIFTYYNNRRKDKLRAYEDNLNKYFREKENQAKIEIANKILDTISSGKLNHEQENRLISALSSDSRSSQNTLLEESSSNKQIPKIEII